MPLRYRKKTVDEVLDFYLSLPARGGQQARFQKTKKQWLEILERESRGKFSPYCVLIPRALRRKGRVHLIENGIFVSTNFLVCYGMSKRTSVLLSTWVSTIFFQLICEVSSKDQEGLRKMEISDIKLTYVPDFSIIPESLYDALNDAKDSISFIDLQSPEIRPVDVMWGEYLFGENYEHILSDAKNLLSYVATRRNGD